MTLDKNSIVVVTGAASGMGLAVSEQYSKKGIKVAMLDMNEHALLNAAEKLHATPYVVDVSSEQALTEVFSAIVTQGDIRGLVCCAGIAPAKKVVGRDGAHPLSNFSKVLSVNLVGTFNAIRLASLAMSQLPPMNDDGERGVIITTASVAAFEGQIGQAAYSASKGGVVGMTLPIARELAQHGIRVNCIAPGLVATPMLLSMPQTVQDSLSASVPFPKRLGQPDEFAKLVLHMFENTMMNGEVVRLDGAIRMQPK